MKTKAQKAEEIKRGEGLLEKSKALVFVDLSHVGTADARKLRQTLKSGENPLMVIKKRLLGVILKNRGMAFDDSSMKTSVGTVFASNLESAASAVYQFVKALQKEKKIESEKIVGGYDMERKEPIPVERLLLIGKLPAREVLLAQLAAMIAAPVRSLLYIMKVKSERS